MFYISLSVEVKKKCFALYPSRNCWSEKSDTTTILLNGLILKTVMAVAQQKNYLQVQAYYNSSNIVGCRTGSINTLHLTQGRNNSVLWFLQNLVHEILYWQYWKLEAENNTCVYKSRQHVYRRVSQCTVYLWLQQLYRWLQRACYKSTQDLSNCYTSFL